MKRPTNLASAIELFASKTPLQPIYGLLFEPGKEQRFLVLHALEAVLAGEPEIMFPGAAGTGKTTTLEVFLMVLKDCGRTSTCCAPTWKAAQRAKEASGREFVTIHSIVFAGAEEVVEVDENGEKEEFGEELEFNRRRPGSANVGNVLVIDEASMIGAELVAEMWRVLPAGVSVVAVGDPHQLPPVKEKAGFRLDLAPFSLSKVYRQEEASPVLQAATKIRNERVPFTYSKACPEWKRGEEILEESGVYSKWADVDDAGHTLYNMFRRTDGNAAAIVGTHRSRVALNDSMRGYLGFPARSKGPQKGERLVCRATGAGLRNADVVTVLDVEHVHFGERFGDGWIMRVKNGYEREIAVLRQTWEDNYHPKFRGLVPRTVKDNMKDYCGEDIAKFGAKIYREVDKKCANYEEKHDGEKTPAWLKSLWVASEARRVGAYALYLKKHLASVDSGYAITCHAAQGSQYKEIVVVADMVDFIAENVGEQVYRWSYTALTRAEEHAVIIRKRNKGGWN